MDCFKRGCFYPLDRREHQEGAKRQDLKNHSTYDDKRDIAFGEEWVCFAFERHPFLAAPFLAARNRKLEAPPHERQRYFDIDWRRGLFSGIAHRRFASRASTQGWKTDQALDVLGGFFSRGSVVLPSGIVGSSIYVHGDVMVVAVC